MISVCAGARPGDAPRVSVLVDHLAAQLENASQGLEICITVDAEAADVRQLLSGDPAALRRKGVVWALEPAGLRESGLAVVATTLASGDHLWLLDENAALPAPGALGTISRLVSLVPHATGAAFSAATGLEPGTTEVLRGPEAEQASAGRDQVVLREAWMLALAELGGTAALASTPGGAARIRAAMALRRPVWARVTAALRSPTPAATGPRRHRLRRPAQPPEPPVTPAGAASPALRPPIGATGHPARGELAAVWTAPTHDTVVRGNVLGAGLAIASRLGLAAAEFVEGTNPEHAVAAARTTGVLVIPLIEQVLAHPTDIAELFETADREGWRLVIGDFGADSHAAGASRIADYFAELAAVTEAGCGPLPSRALRARVSTGGDQTYRRSGLLHTRAFSDALRAAGCRLEATDTLLEWGAGCGRMTTHLLALAPQAAVTGVDPDPDTIAWVRDHLPATALATAIDPPLPLADDAFDLVIGHSVFSHLAADAQDRWLAELARVIRPGGHAAVTINGPIGLDWHLRHPLAKMPAAFEALTRRDGISFWRGEGWEETFDDGYHTTFHAPAYIREHWSRWFEVVAVAEGAGSPLQDIVVLRVPGG